MKLLYTVFLLIFFAAAALATALEDNNSGLAALKDGRFDDAIHFFKIAMLQEPANPAIQNNLAVTYNNAAMDSQKNGNFDAAYKYMKEAYNLDPQSVRLKKNFAYMLTGESARRYKEKSGKDIIGLLEESAGYDNSLTDTFFLLGQAYYDTDKYPEAKLNWEKAQSLDPANEIIKQRLEKLNREIAAGGGSDDADRYHFKVRYDGAQMWVASHEVLNILEDAYNNAGWKLQIFPEQPVTVIIYTQEQFQTVSGMSDWFAGAYDGKIRLRKIDAEGDQKRLRQIVYHEYMHAIMHYVAGNNVPTWLNEGIAQCYENMPDKTELNWSEKKLIKERLDRGLPEMSAVDQMFHSTTSQADVNFAYAFSKGFVAYLIEKGWDINIKNMLGELASGSTADSAFEKIYCRSIEQMRSDWLNDMKFN
jgi:tetratricopeptide (TPR) repeat protein